MLSIAAAISLALGLFQDFGTPRERVQCGDDPSQTCELPAVDWIEGVAIIVAIMIVGRLCSKSFQTSHTPNQVDIVGAVNDWQKERQFKKLNEKKEDRTIKVKRGGQERVINIKEVLVGDIALLEPGEIVPVDGIFLRGHSVKCDESGATGESDAIKKVPYEQCLAAKDDPEFTHTDCFLISGSKILEGVGEYVVIAVGTRSFHGRIMMGTLYFSLLEGWG
jgi:P-type Ca2+ transporter type 2C